MRLRAGLAALTTLLAIIGPVGAAQAHHRAEHSGTVVKCNGLPKDGYPKSLIQGSDGAETLKGTAGNDVIIGWGGDDTILGNGGDDTICGMGGADYISGGGGDDFISGGAGRDQVVGRDGNDTIQGDAGTDTVYYYPSPAPAKGKYGVNVDLKRRTDQAIATDGIDQLNSIETVYGSHYDDILRGNGVRNYLDGAGDDDLTNSGNDYIDGRGGHDILVGRSGKDTLIGRAGNDYLQGQDDNDKLLGGANIDALAGGLGNDTMYGDDGFDYVDYECPHCADAGVGQSVYLTAGEDGWQSSSGGQGADRFKGVEGASGSRFDDTLVGTSNVQGVDKFGDYFWPGHGNDVVNGLDGPDYVDYDLSQDHEDDGVTCKDIAEPGITMNLTSAPGDDDVTGYQGSDQLEGIEHAIGSGRADTIRGSDLANDLWGGCGDDTINGGGDTDIIDGDDGDDVVSGDAGDDRLNGGPGDDALLGGHDHDIVSYDSLYRDSATADTAGVAVQLGAGTAQGDGEDSIASTEVIIGSEYNDTLVGGSTADILIGGAGADELWGRDNADVLLGNGVPKRSRRDALDFLYGGPGVDTADYSQEGAGVEANLSADLAAATAGTSVDFFSGMEALQGSPYRDVLTGDAAKNYLLGGGGRDDLHGMGESDYLDGARGDDKYFGGTGLDTVDFADVDNSKVVILESGAVTLSRGSTSESESVNSIDVIAGTAGDDVISGGEAADYLAGEAGDDTLRGLGGGDWLFGGAGANELDGGAGSNTCFEGTMVECAAGSDPTVEDGWYDIHVAEPRDFVATGDDSFLNDLDEIIEELRRLHHRRLHH